MNCHRQSAPGCPNPGKGGEVGTADHTAVCTQLCAFGRQPLRTRSGLFAPGAGGGNGLGEGTEVQSQRKRTVGCSWMCTVVFTDPPPHCSQSTYLPAADLATRDLNISTMWVE